MTTLWTPSDARIPRAALPQGNVTLRAGLVLTYCEQCTHGQEHVYRLAGVADPHVAVYHGPHEKMLVIAALDPTDRWGDLLHVSMSYKDRNPSWTEIRLVRDAFYGKYRDAMMVLPRDADYVNVHQHCFHLWETPESWRIR